MMLFSFPTSPENIMFCSSPLRCHANFCLSVVCDWQLARFANLTGGRHYGDRSKQTGTDTFAFYGTRNLSCKTQHFTATAAAFQSTFRHVRFSTIFQLRVTPGLDWRNVPVDTRVAMTANPSLLGCSCFQKKAKPSAGELLPPTWMILRF